jgi:Fic family protein
MLPIFNESYRPSSQWAQELARKIEAVRQAQPFAAEISTRIEEHLLVEEVFHNLVLGDIKIEHERVRELLTGEASAAQSIAERATINFGNAARHLRRLIANSAEKSKFLLTADLLRELHALTMAGLADDGGFYRAGAARPLGDGHQPADADALDILIDNALDWFNVQSFEELHAIEQAWLAHLRLMDLQPFASANGRVARLASSLYTLRAGLPPIIVRVDQRELYNFALTNSFQMITQPGIELFAKAVGDSLDEIIKLADV